MRGRRARALAGGDPVLVAHYRSMLDYQSAPYEDLAALLRGVPGQGRDDLDVHSRTIATVSRAATPFVLPYLREVAVAVDPTRLLDLGCGTGVYLRTMLEAAPRATGVGVDLAADAIGTYDLVTLVNNVYYFDPTTRVDLYRDARTALTPAGALVVVTMAVPGSPAAAHLDLMLRAQAGHASLPAGGEVERDLRAAGFTTIETTKLVPGEHFVGIPAR